MYFSARCTSRPPHIMLTPSSSPAARPILVPRTNVLTTPQARAKLFLPTPPADSKATKRPLPAADKPALKRLKLGSKDVFADNEDSETESEWDSDGDVDMRDATTERVRERTNAAYQLHTQFIANPISRCRRQPRKFALISNTHLADTLR